MKALARLQAKEAIPNLMLLLIKGDTTPIETLAQLDAKEAITVLMAFLNDKNKEDERRDVIRALVKLEAKEAIPALVLLLNNDRFRLDAIDGLAKLQAKEAIPSLLSLFARSHDSVRMPTFEALVQIQGKKAVPMIISLLKGRTVNSESQIAIKALVKVQGKKAVPTLIGLLTENSMAWASCQEAIKALVELEGKDAVPTLMGLIIIKDDYVSRAAIEALKQLPIDDAVFKQPIFLAAERRLSQVLAQVKVKNAMPDTLSLLKNASQYIRKAAIDAVVQSKETKAIPLLILMAKNQSEPLRR